VGQFFYCSGWVSNLWFGFGLGKLPLKITKFSIFCPSGKKISSGRAKDRLASYLLQVKSMLGSGQVPSIDQTML